MTDREREDRLIKRGAIWGTAAILVVMVAVGAGCPLYNVWKKEQDGRAALSEAEHQKQVEIEEAKAHLEAERLNAEAEVERAKGAADAIEIEGGKLTPEYIQYLWVRSNQFNDKTTIYIPTEGNLPILEAGRRP